MPASSRKEMRLIATNQASLDFPQIIAGESSNLGVVCPGAKVGDIASLGLPAAPTAGIVFQGFVSARDTVTVRASNITGEAINPAAQTIAVMVFRLR